MTSARVVCPTLSLNWSTTAVAAAASSCATCRTTSQAWPRWKSGATSPRNVTCWRSAPPDFERFKAICERERCPFAVVGEATDEPQLTVTDSHFGNNPVDMPLEVLLGKAPRMHRSAERETELGDDFDPSALDIEESVQRVLHHPAVASKSFLITIGDRSITGMVTRDQMVGPWQVPVADVAVTATSFDVYTGEAMAMGERTPLALLDAPASGRMAIGETLTNIAASSIGKLSDIKLSANWMSAAGHPGEDARLYDTVKAVGMELCPELGITIPVGKDSMSMETRWSDEGDRKNRDLAAVADRHRFRAGHRHPQDPDPATAHGQGPDRSDPDRPGPWPEPHGRVDSRPDPRQARQRRAGRR